MAEEKMMEEQDAPIQVGQWLQKEWIDLFGMTQRGLAREIGVQPTLLNEIISGKRRISPKIAVRLEKVFECPAIKFLMIQSEYDVYLEKKKQT